MQYVFFKLVRTFYTNYDNQFQDLELQRASIMYMYSKDMLKKLNLNGDQILPQLIIEQYVYWITSVNIASVVARSTCTCIITCFFGSRKALAPSCTLYILLTGCRLDSISAHVKKTCWERGHHLNLSHSRFPWSQLMISDI